MHDDGDGLHASGFEVIADGLNHIEVEGLAAFEFVGAVGGADGCGEGIAAGATDEFHGFFGIGEAGVAFIDDDVFFDTAEHT